MASEDEYELVMPFVVVTSKGGPYDDASYVAGCEAGAIEAALRQIAAHRPKTMTLAPFWMANVHTPNVPQVDRIAMAHGFEVEAEPIMGMEDEWTAVTFRFARIPE